jgi:GntP family gluconate:H+ symporter
MSSELQAIIGLIIGVVILVFLVVRTKVHAFPALIIAASIVGLAGGLAPADVAEAITAGFGDTLAVIGLVIGFAVMLGKILEAAGASERLAYSFLRLFGRRREEPALAFTGYVVSIPVFVDSAFVILTPLARALSARTGKSVIALGVALGIGLTATHHAVPPTPGPLAVAGIFGVDIGLMIIWGLILSIPLVLTGVVYARWIGNRIYQLPDEDSEEEWYRPEETQTYSEADSAETNEELPSLAWSLETV